MNSNALKYTNKILDASGLSQDIQGMTPKESKAAMKKLKRLLKDIEFLRRTGGITLIVAEDSIVTTYHNNSMNRKLSTSKINIFY
ncbi:MULTISPECIES: hypothetical protein [unclassified Psychrobacter]|uniref:hypothetical protein n=1 Tax=unclassified Psychrobacter TaxID=196806 RepID=UPI003F477DF4